MSDPQDFGFGKFVPGFDFLQNLASSAAKGASPSMPQMPNLGNWVAPTLNVEDLDKRIEELKAVQFWLDQNAMALKATIQALEVQKMTLATLKGMNFDLADIANAFKINPFAAAAAPAPAAAPAHAPAPPPAPAPTFAAPASTPAPASANAPASAAPESGTAGKDEPAAGVVDPMQWWGALTQQFQQIAVSALQDAASKAALDSARTTAAGRGKPAAKATGRGKPAAKAASGKAVNATKKAASTAGRTSATGKKTVKNPVKKPVRKST